MPDQAIPDQAIPDKGAYLQELNDAVVAAFPDLDELKRLIQYKFEWLLDNRVYVKAANQTVVFETIRLFEGDGKLSQFIWAVAQSRPHNPLVRAFCSQHHPQFIDRMADSQAAADVDKGLKKIKEVRDQPAVKQVLQGISGDIKLVCAGIFALELLKQLHEVLHNIDFGLFKLLTKAARDFRTRPDGENELVEFSSYTEDFADKVTEARKLADALGTEDRRVLSGWVEKLELAAVKLRDALPPGTANPLAPIQMLIQPTLGQAPSAVYAKLVEDARQIPLDKLLAGIRQMAPLFQHENIAILKSCETGLEVLQERLRDVISEHYFWQKVDNDLRLIDKAITPQAGSEVDWLEEILLLLPTILRDIETICMLHQNEAWREPLRLSRADLLQALESKKSASVRLGYNSCQRRARGRFYEVDAELLKVCSQLVTLNGPLAELNTL